MNVIAITTSSRQGSVAVARKNSPPLEQTFTRETEHGRGLAPALRELLDQLNLTPRDIDLVGVDIGPGSYTGLRVGLATAQMLAFASNARLLGVRSLDAVVEAIPPDGFSVCAVLDARWGTVYARFYDRKKSHWECRGEPFFGPVTELAKQLDANMIVTGPGLEAYESALRGCAAQIAPAELWFPRAVSVASVALRKLAAGNDGKLFDIELEYFRSA